MNTILDTMMDKMLAAIQQAIPPTPQVSQSTPPPAVTQQRSNSPAVQEEGYTRHDAVISQRDGAYGQRGGAHRAEEAWRARGVAAHQANTMGLEHYVTVVLACSHSMGWNDHDAATVWSKWDASHRHRMIIRLSNIGRSIFERIETIRSLGPAQQLFECCIHSILDPSVGNFVTSLRTSGSHTNRWPYTSVSFRSSTKHTLIS